MEIGLEAAPKTSKTQLFGRLLLGLMLFNSGVSHLTYLRQPFQAQVPPWVPLNPDLVVVLSGCVEIIVGLSLMTLYRRKAYVGIIAALFFVAVFPGNIAQYTEQRGIWLGDGHGSIRPTFLSACSGRLGALEYRCVDRPSTVLGQTRMMVQRSNTAEHTFSYSSWAKRRFAETSQTARRCR
jgi:uncharacterized membrane protein